MSSFNRAVLVGRLTRDPEIKYTPQGTQMAKFSLAVDRARQKGECDFINVTAWGKLAEICGQYLSKGKLVLIEGEIRTRNYETTDGQKRTSFEVNANSMQMLGGKGESGPREYGGPHKSRQDAPATAPAEEWSGAVDVDQFDAEDMPF